MNSFGKSFRKVFTKNKSLSSELQSLLENFEEKLSDRLKELKPKEKKDILTLSWLKSAIQSLCEIHIDIKDLITSLELPINKWDEKWIDVYLEDSVKLLDLCISFTSEISRLNQGHLYLQCALHNMNSVGPTQFTKAQSSLDGWKKHVGSKNVKLEKCFITLNSLIETLNLPKIKNSVKGKVLMQGMHGVKVVTVFICGILGAAFSGSAKNLVDLEAPEGCLWTEAFNEMQGFVNGEIRDIFSNGNVSVLKELEVVNGSVEKLCEGDGLKMMVLELGEKADELAQGLDLLGKELDGFFQIVLKGRDALLGNLRVGSVVSIPMERRNHVEGELVK